MLLDSASVIRCEAFVPLRRVGRFGGRGRGRGYQHGDRV